MYMPGACAPLPGLRGSGCCLRRRRIHGLGRVLGVFGVSLHGGSEMINGRPLGEMRKPGAARSLDDQTRGSDAHRHHDVLLKPGLSGTVISALELVSCSSMLIISWLMLVSASIR